MVDAHLRSKTIETADIKNMIIGGQTGIDGIRFCLAAVTNGENLADPAFSWFLQYKNKNGQGESVGLTPVYENGLVKLPWVPNKLATQVPGRMQIQLYAAIVTGEGEAAVVDKQWVSEFAIIYIQENINPDPIVATEPSVIEYYVTLYAAYKNAAEAAAAAALESEQAAALSESNAADSEAAALASKQAAGLSEQAAALAAGSALGSKNSIDATFTDPGLVAVRTDMATPETSKIQKVAANEVNITEVADDLNLGSASKITKVADDIAKVGAVADGMTHVTAVEAKLTDIAKVAAIEVAVPKVAAIDTDVTKVAAIDEAVSLVAGVKDDVTAVALIDEEISAIALIKDQIVSLEAEKLKVSAVEAKLSEILGVYAKLQAIEGLYGKSTEIDALYAQLDVIAEKANAKDMVELRADYDLTKAQTDTRITAIGAEVQKADSIYNFGSLSVLGTGTASDWATPVTVDAQNGDMGLVLQGNTGTNLSTGVWVGAGSSTVDGVTTFNIIGGANNGFSSQTKTFINGNIYVFRVFVRANQSGALNIQLRAFGTLIASMDNPVAGTWYELIGFYTGVSTDIDLRVRFQYPSVEEGVGKTCSFKEAYFSNLTALGHATKLNTTSKCQAYFQNYHAGTLGVGEVRARTVGRSLIDLKNDRLLVADPTASLVYEEGLLCWKITNRTMNAKIIDFDKFLQNTRYTATITVKQVGTGNPRIIIRYTDGTITYLPTSVAPTSFTTYNITSTVLKTIKQIEWEYGSTTHTLYVVVDTFMLELGSTATTYEPYRESVAWTPPIGYRLPNGVHDSYDVVSGVHTKRAHKLILTGQETWFNDSAANVFGFNSGIAFINLSSGINNAFCNYYSYVFASTSILSDKMVSLRSTGIVYVKDTAYTDYSMFKAYVASMYAAGTPIEIYYELPPITTQYDPQYPQSFKGGSMFLDAGKRDGMVYGATGLEFAFDILSVEKLYKFQAGEKVEITDSAINGKFVTSPSLSIGDICYIEVLYKSDQSLVPVSVSKVPYVNLSTLMTVLKGGAIGQVLRKKSNTDWDFEWVTL